MRKTVLKAWWTPVLALVLMIAHCAPVSLHYKQGMALYKQGDYDRALQHLKKAVEENPGRKDFRLALFRSRLNSYYHHLALARKHRANDDRERALEEYQTALALFPDNSRIREEYEVYAMKKSPEPEKEPESTITLPVTLQVDDAETITLNLKNTPVVQIFKVLGKSYGINFIFDRDFRDFLYTIEVRDVGFYDILNQLCMVANARYRILDPHSVLIYPNTAIKKKSFDLIGVKTFYLDHIYAEDGKRLIQAMFRDERIMIEEDPNLNALIVKTSSDTLMEIERFIRRIDKEKSEVEIDIQIIEVNRTLLNKIGMEFGLNPLTLSAGTRDQAETATQTPTIEWTNLKDSVIFLTIPSVALNILEQDEDNRIIAQPNLRGLDAEEIKFMVGDELPIPQTTWQPIAAGGVANSPVTSYEYKNVGVEITLTPIIHSNNEVTIRFKFTMNFVTSQVENFPVLGKRELENVIRLREGETNIIGGFIKDEVRGSLTGLPALAKIPVLGRLFGASEKTINQTDLIISISPRVVRQLDVRSRDLDPVWTNVQGADQNNVAQSQTSRGETTPGAMAQSVRNTLSISPVRRRIPVDTPTFFSIRLNSSSDVSTISMSGAVAGGAAVIEDLVAGKGGGEDVRELKDFSDDTFDLGLSYLAKPVRNAPLARLKIRFLEKGNYTIRLTGVTAYDPDRRIVELETSESQIEVY